jgi:hypothetical protein
MHNPLAFPGGLGQVNSIATGIGASTKNHMVEAREEMHGCGCYRFGGRAEPIVA